MHEYALCVALLEQLERLARQHDAERVERILLQVGPLSGVEAELLERAWPLAAAHTVAQDAELVVEASPVVVRCNRCGGESEVPPARLLCANCGDFRTRVIAGDQMLLSSVELVKRE